MAMDQFGLNILGIMSNLVMEIKMDNGSNGIRGRRLKDKEYKEMLFREQVKEEERVSKMIELLTLKLESDKGER